MSRPTYDIEHESDGGWTVTRNGWRLDGSEFLTREEAEAAVDCYEREDEAREQDDDDYGARVDWEFEKTR